MTTSPLPSHILAPLPSWQGTLPGSGEFAALLNAISDAALVADRSSGALAFANRGFFELTGLSPFENELPGLAALLPEMESAWSSGEERETRLILPGGKSLPLWVSVTWLDKPGRWWLARLIPVEVYRWRAMQMRRDDQWLEALERLAELTSQPDLDSALNAALEVGKNLIGAQTLGIYRADIQLLRLVRVRTLGERGEALPDSLALDKPSAIYSPSLWLTGQRAVTELQQSARALGMASIVSTPIELNGSRLGLLVAADLPPTSTRQLVESLSILAAHIAATLQHYMALNSLNRSARESRRALAIRDTISENTPDGILLLHPSLKVLSINPAAENMFGYAQEEVVGLAVENILIGPDNLPAGLRMALQGVASPDLGNLRLHRRSGRVFPAQVQIFPVESGRELINIVVLVRDMSEHEDIRARTQQLEQRALLGEITAIFAHEVRNPVNNISTGLQLMGMNLPADDPGRDLVERLQGDCDRLTHLMESVLAFSRPMEYKIVPTDLKQNLATLLERWRPRMTRLNIEPVFKVDENLPLALADARALEQVFTNLISNAITAMRESGGTLALRLENAPAAEGRSGLVVSVSDTGPGIPSELREKVFEPFFTTSPQGTGLGLAITKRIVLAHKGRIEVESFPGGTIFKVFLPAERKD
ncbi:MAG: hypothetical protein OHK0031_03370 [Anaerolineales bacterium]